MSETQGTYTPGPWIAEPNGGAFNITNPDRAHHAILLGMTYNIEGEHEANARLIAAAPDLFEALEETLDGLRAARQFCGPFWHGQARETLKLVMESIDKAESAIAKAEGDHRV